jgi:hypothetical protein
MTTEDRTPEQYTLSEDQIRDYVTTNDDHFRQVLVRTEKLVDDNAGQDDAEQITIRAASLREMQMTMASMYKTLRDSVLDEEFLAAGGDRGDRGSNCDYNPFNRINHGDGVNH